MLNITHHTFNLAKEDGFSQKSISIATGISEESLSRAKKRGSMSTGSLERIAQAIGYQIVLEKLPENHANSVITAKGIDDYA